MRKELKKDPYGARREVVEDDEGERVDQQEVFLFSPTPVGLLLVGLDGGRKGATKAAPFGPPWKWEGEDVTNLIHTWL